MVVFFFALQTAVDTLFYKQNRPAGNGNGGGGGHVYAEDQKCFTYARLSLGKK